MKKLMIGLVLTAICGGVGATAWATTNNGEINRNSVNVQPVNNNIKSEIENYINNTYGSNWAIDLYEKNGEEWDEILENELENKFGHNYEDIIDNIIDAKEFESGLDIDNDDLYDDQDDNDDIYDDQDDINDIDDNDDQHDNDDINDTHDDDPGTGGTGALSIPYASNITFGQQEIRQGDTDYFAMNQKPHVQVNDTRGGAKGWTLGVTISPFLGENGKELTGAKM